MPGIETNRKPDFSGYVTKYNILCTDGRTIRPGAFKELDGQYVPLVYMHNHKDLDKVLGKMLLEHRDDGVYGYGFFNSTDRGKTGKILVDHGDISCLSIFANQLKQQGGDVLHGNIQEVSLVLAGANRGAVIDSRLAHSDNEDEEAFICMGDIYSDGIYVNDEDLSFEDYIEHYGVKGMKWGKQKAIDEDRLDDDPSSKGLKEKLFDQARSMIAEGKAKEAEIQKAEASKVMIENAEKSVATKNDAPNSEKNMADDGKTAPKGERLDTSKVGDILERDGLKDRIRQNLMEALKNRENSQNDSESIKPDVKETTQPEKKSDEKTDEVEKKDEQNPIDKIRAKLKDLSNDTKEMKELKGNPADLKLPEVEARIEQIRKKYQKKSDAKHSDNSDALSHSDSNDPEKGDKEKPNVMVHDGFEADDYISHGESKTYSQVLSEMDKEQLGTVYYILKKLRIGLSGDIEHSDIETGEFLAHYGRKGMKWGEHRFLDDESSNNPDTSQSGSTQSSSHRHGKSSTRAEDVVDQFIANKNKKTSEEEIAKNKVLSGLRDYTNAAYKAIGDPDKIDWSNPVEVGEVYKKLLPHVRSMGVKIADFNKAYPNSDIGKDLRELSDYLNDKLPGGKLSVDFDERIMDMDSLKRDFNEVLEAVSIANKIQKVFEQTSKFKHSDDFEDFIEHSDPQTISAIFNAMTDEQKDTVYYLANQLKAELESDSAKHYDEEDNSMKENVFDMSMENKGKTLSHAEELEFASAVFADFKRTGSLKDAFLAHAGDYGIDQIDWLFPDAKNVTNTPIWIKRPDGWVPKVMNAVSHSPFSRIKSMFADITEPDARAKGYIKGNRKTEEVFGLLKRTTTPTTVYKKQKLDRDDIIDITDFDVVAWLKTEMRGMLDEELARAVLVSDGRSPASDDKINEQNIRPIWTDDDLFVIRKAIAVTSSTTVDEKCKQFIRAAIKARKDYRGSGNPTLYTTEDILTDMLLMEDNLGHPLYETEEKLCRKLRVKEIVTVPVMENLSRVVNGMNMELMGIIVNLTDYKVGADKGGAINMFDDFDIDYNQQKYLIETRCSGALTVPYSAIVIEATSSAYLEIEPDDPDTIRYGKDVADLQDNVVINDDSISGTLKYVTGYTGFSGDVEEQSGNYLAFSVIAPNGATNTVQLVGGGASGNVVDLQSDDYCVVRIKSKNTKLILTSTINGLTVTKTYSLRLLKLLSE